MMKAFFIGIDGGGTKTCGKISDREGSQTATVTKGASNYHNKGIEETYQTLEAVIQGLIQAVDAPLNAVQKIVFCGAGVDTPDDQQVIASLFDRMGYRGKLRIENDAVGALVGATGGEKDAILISGTGSIAYGYDKNHHVIRVGGWGHIIGDEGSGYWMAKEGLTYVSQAADGRKKRTKLKGALMEALGVVSPEQIIGFLYAEDASKEKVADLAPVILGLYHDDPHARDIVDRAVLGLCELIDALYQRSGLSKLEIKLSGSVLTKSELVRQLLANHYDSRPEIVIDLPQKNAVEGALILALA